MHYYLLTQEGGGGGRFVLDVVVNSCEMNIAYEMRDA